MNKGGSPQIIALPVSPWPLRLRAVGLQNFHAGPFDFDLAAGECLSVTGPSGAGKSLLLRMLADLDDHTGEVWLDGIPCSSVPAPDWRRSVRYVAAEPGWWHDTVAPHFTSPAGDILERFALSPTILERAVALCSTGERQRLALARALLDRPSILLLDEPTGALDDENTARAERLLLDELAAGAGIVLVTHASRQAAALGTRHLRIVSGRFVDPDPTHP